MYKMDHLKNSYIIDKNTTSEEWQSTFDEYSKVKNIICNSETAEHFRVSLFTQEQIQMYADPKYEWRQMHEIRKVLENRALIEQINTLECKV